MVVAAAELQAPAEALGVLIPLGRAFVMSNLTCGESGSRGFTS